MIIDNSRDAEPIGMSSKCQMKSRDKKELRFYWIQSLGRCAGGTETVLSRCSWHVTGWFSFLLKFE
jgi:hypothetical protein